MSPYARLLQPPSFVLPGLESGRYAINEAGNRVVEAGSKKFVAALVPTESFSSQLTQLPLNPAEASKIIEASDQLRAAGPLLSAMKLTSTVGALASVANLAVSCVGFALVLHKLSRIEGKLDEALEKLELLKRAVDELKGHTEALSAARLRSAGECLDRAVAAESRDGRQELASRARNLFQEAKNLHLELWRRATPWEQGEVPIPAAMEMKARFEVAALGEMQAEFVRGDMGAFRHAVKTIARDFATNYCFDAVEALRARSDQACVDSAHLARFAHEVPQVTAQIALAVKTTKWTHRRLVAFEDDADLPDALGIEPHEVAKATRSASGDGLYLLVAA